MHYINWCFTYLLKGQKRLSMPPDGPRGSGRTLLLHSYNKIPSQVHFELIRLCWWLKTVGKRFLLADTKRKDSEHIALVIASFGDVNCYTSEILFYQTLSVLHHHFHQCQLVSDLYDKHYTICSHKTTLRNCYSSSAPIRVQHWVGLITQQVTNLLKVACSCISLLPMSHWVSE